MLNLSSTKYEIEEVYDIGCFFLEAYVCVQIDAVWKNSRKLGCPYIFISQNWIEVIQILLMEDILQELIDDTLSHGLRRVCQVVAVWDFFHQQ